MKKYIYILLLVFLLPFLSRESRYVSSQGITDLNSEAALQSATQLAVQSVNVSYASHASEASVVYKSTNEAPEALSGDTPTQETQPGTVPTPQVSLNLAQIPEALPTVIPAPAVSPSAAPTPEASPSHTPTPEKNVEIIYPINSFSDTGSICLTFDDGGNKKAVEKALEVLKRHDVKCTFFVVGKYMKAHPELWKQAAEDGHEICNHTQNHKWLSDLNDEGVKKEILDWETTVAEILGEDYLKKMKQEYPYLRIPYNAGGNSKRVLRIIAESGYIPIGWNIETYYAIIRHHDTSTEPVENIAGEVAAHVTKRAKGGSIVLLHFNMYDVYRLDEIISSIKAKGLTMKSLSEADL